MACGALISCSQAVCPVLPDQRRRPPLCGAPAAFYGAPGVGDCGDVGNRHGTEGRFDHVLKHLKSRERRRRVGEEIHRVHIMPSSKAPKGKGKGKRKSAAEIDRVDMVDETREAAGEDALQAHSRCVVARSCPFSQP